jgi:hypothetical protein
MTPFTLSVILIRLCALFTLAVSVFTFVASYVTFENFAPNVPTEANAFTVLQTFFLVPILLLISSAGLYILARPIAKFIARDL